MSAWIAFNNCGWLSYVMVLVFLVSLPTALIALVLAFVRPRPGRIVAIASLVLGMLNVTMGASVELRAAMTCDATVRSLEDVDPAQYGAIKAEIVEEASGCTKIGFALSALPATMSAVAVVAAWILHRRARERAILDGA